MTNPPSGFGDTRRFRVARTVDEFGKDRFFVEDDNADWIGMPFDTAEAAFEEIERLEQDRMPNVSKFRFVLTNGSNFVGTWDEFNAAYPGAAREDADISLTYVLAVES